MITNGKFGANTQTGVIYEGNVDLASFLKTLPGYKIKLIPKLSGRGRSKAYSVLFNNKPVASIYKQHSFYRLLESEGLDYTKYISKQLLPDDSIFVMINNTFFIIEVKHQEKTGSVDEKLQTCDFKRKQYKKLLSYFNCEVEYIYILNDWFKKDEYKDVLNYIISMNCKYYFNYIPLIELGLPIPDIPMP